MAQVAKKLDDAASPAKLSGLCSTCKHTDYCCFPKDSETPVTFCEEFEVCDAPVYTFIAPANNAKPDTAKLVGLCRNCEKNTSCHFAKPESGVWHCEEYE